MSKARIVMVLLSVFVTMPIWFYLLYKMLQAVNASELMWFMYWIYIPVTFLISLISKLISDED